MFNTQRMLMGASYMHGRETCMHACAHPWNVHSWRQQTVVVVVGLLLLLSARLRRRRGFRAPPSSSSLASQQQQQQQREMGFPSASHPDPQALAPLLLPPHLDLHPDCPGCLLRLKKASAKGPPRKELAFVAFLVLCNALPIASLFPFIYFMVRDFGIAKSSTSITTYAGYIGSAMMLGRFMTSAVWGMLADRFGRKPVMFVGTASIIIFNTMFGFSTNFWFALTTRFLLGACNGILGTVRAYASELCSKEYQALGISLVGTMWGVGLIIGPAIGGYLAQPSEKYPTLFPSGTLFSTFPYALPCMCISTFAVGGLVLSFYIPETFHNHPKDLHVPEEKIAGGNNADETNITDDVENAKVMENSDASEGGRHNNKKPLWRNREMIASVSVYCLWALHSMAYSEIFSLWAVSPKIYGGLAFTTSEVGDVLAVTGASLLLFQLLIFPQLVKCLGAIRVVRIPTAFTIGLIVTYPLIARLDGISLWLVLLPTAALKNVLSTCVVTGTFILINNSVDSSQRGTANGISTSLMSLFKAVAPASAGVILSWAQGRMDASFLPGMWMVFVILSGLAFVSLVATIGPLLPEYLNEPPAED